MPWRFNTTTAIQTLDLKGSCRVAVATNVARSGGSVTLSVTFSSGTPGTLTRSTGSWITDGFVAGQTINVSGTASNNGNKTVSSVTATVLTINEASTAETAANTTVSLVLDGIVISNGDRILLLGQTTASQNGIYAATAGTWIRTPDADTSAKVTSGMLVHVEEGNTNSDTWWVLTTNNPITLDTTNLTFSKFPNDSINGMLTFTSGAAVTGSSYQIGRNNASPNGLQFNVPSGGTMTWSVNGAQKLYLYDGVAPANDTGASLWVLPSLTEASSGTHNGLIGMYIERPTITDGAATTLYSAGVQVVGVHTGGAAPTYSIGLLVGLAGSSPATTVVTGGSVYGLFVSSMSLTSSVGNTDTHAHLYVAAATTTNFGTMTATTTRFAAIYCEAPWVAASVGIRTITTASTVYISGPPASAGNVVFTNGPYSLYVGGGTTYLGGTLQIVYGGIDHDGGNIGFFGAAPVGQQISGANLTNNVTPGGVDNVIDNYTDLTTYSVAAPTIRNNIYQLARKLKQVNDALRAYGLLS